MNAYVQVLFIWKGGEFLCDSVVTAQTEVTLVPPLVQYFQHAYSQQPKLFTALDSLLKPDTAVFHLRLDPDAHTDLYTCTGLN
jgi:hypothetical protein